MFFVILIVEIVYLFFSWDRLAKFFSASDAFSDRPIRSFKINVIFFARVVLIILIVLLLILMCCKPVSAAEQVRMQLSRFATSLTADCYTLQKFMHSVLFDHYLEREVFGSQCEALQEYFNTHAQHCKSEGLVFTQQQKTFMKIMCLSSVLHGNESTISSLRTRGLMQLLFVRLWPMSNREKDVALHVQRVVSSIGLRARLA